MVRLTLVAITLFVISLVFMGVSYAETWYWEDFDDFDDGEIAGQGGWEVAQIASRPELTSSFIQSDVAYGDTGKSVKSVGGTYVIQFFEGERAGIQHIGFYSLKETATSRMRWYIGAAEEITWYGSAAFGMGDFPAPAVGIVIALEDGKDDAPVGEIELGEWIHYHCVIDFDSERWDLYVDGEQLVDDFKFFGAVGPDNPPHLGWMFMGESHPEWPLVAYTDNISVGTGEGDPNMPPAAVSSSGKMATTWAELKK